MTQTIKLEGSPMLEFWPDQPSTTKTEQSTTYSSFQFSTTNFIRKLIENSSLHPSIEKSPITIPGEAQGFSEGFAFLNRIPSFRVKMSKKRGLSLEEKRTRMLEIFYEKKDFFLLKEMEKIAPREKGIISQSVKDVLQTLVDDSLVDTEKIGTSCYFWAFPSKATAARKKKLSELEPKVEETEKKLDSLDQMIAEAQVGREGGEDRAQVLAELTELRNRREVLRAEIQKYRDCDPELLEELKQEIKMSADGANRWTDNIYALQSWIGRKFPSIDVRDLNKQFGVPEDLDYVE